MARAWAMKNFRLNDETNCCCGSCNDQQRTWLFAGWSNKADSARSMIKGIEAMNSLSSLAKM